MENVEQNVAAAAAVPGAIVPGAVGAEAATEDRFTEATEQMGTMLRWEEAEPAGAEGKTIYLGAVVTGIYSGMKTNVGQNDSTIYELKLADGQLVSFWGSQLIDGKFAQIEIGMEVRVSYLGVSQPKTAKGRPYRNYKIEWAKPVTQMEEVPAVPAEAPVAVTPVNEVPPVAVTTEPAGY